jgi:hypothetical protein
VTPLNATAVQVHYEDGVDWRVNRDSMMAGGTSAVATYIHLLKSPLEISSRQASSHLRLLATCRISVGRE